MPTELDAETRSEAVVDALGLLYHEDLDPDDFMLFPESDGATIETDDDTTYWETADNTQDAFECLVRTILSQNTSDTASQPAHDALMERYDGAGADLAAALAAADHPTLAETIQSAGLYNQKSEKIIGAAEWVQEAYGDAATFDEFVKTGGPAEVRNTLLSVDGVGPKTADCVLLFAGGRAGVFPVDTHVHRIARRMGLAPADADHEAVRAALEQSVPGEKCGFGHTAMIQFGRDYCSARKPACLDDPEACPLADLCDQVGVDTMDGTVVDPAEAAEH
ncbi:MAG: endonuclease III [Haloarculaceae archaeon]